MLYIYTLSHPLTFEIRYVGKTNDLKRRLQSHIDYARSKNKRRKVADWILSVIKQGLKPKITLIESVEIDDWANRERFWINHFRSLGFNLCNLTDGGESNNGYEYSDELKEVRRKARLGWIFPEEVKLKIKESLSKKIVRNDLNDKCTDFERKMQQFVREANQELEGKLNLIESIDRKK